MTRSFPAFGAAVLAGLLATAANAQTSLVGTWSATVNWDQPTGLMITSSFTPNGRVESTTQNHMGQSFFLSGVYRYDGARGILSFEWHDYAPKQTCMGGFCTPAPVPAPLGVTTTNRIRFLNGNQFVASSKDGSTMYMRTNGAGFPAR